MDFFDRILYFQLYIRFAVHIFRTTGDLSCFGPWYVKVIQGSDGFDFTFFNL